MRFAALICAIFLTGCVATTEQTTPTQPKKTETQTTKTQPTKTPSREALQAKAAKKPTRAQMNRFRQVVARVEPVAERACRASDSKAKCDFKIVVDERPQPPNAFQTLDRSGRPILAFTGSLIADVRNSDEIAFILSHEAAHHIRKHIPRQRQSATAGAILLGGLATLAGAGSAGIDVATNVGASVGARSYSKEFELEADATGTVIAKRAGYNPVKGAEYFNRIPDPGNRFLGTHPPNAQRIDIVKKTAAKL